MKTTKRILGLFTIPAAMLLMAVSCEKETFDPSEKIEENPGRIVETRMFTCSIDESSKVDVDADGKTTWEAGDKILVHGQYIGTNSGKLYSTTVTLAAGDISADGKVATIRVTTDTDGIEGIVPYTRSDYTSSLYAAYPADAVVSTSSYYVTYYHSIFSNTNLPLMVAYDQGSSFVFKNVCAAISFTLPSSLDFDSFLFYGNHGETVGYERYAVKTSLKVNGEEGNYFPYTGGDVPNPVSGLITTLSGPVVCDGTTLNTIYVPHNTAFTGGFTIAFVKDGVPVKQVKNGKAITMKKSEYYELGDISSHIKNYAHVSSLTLSDGADYDLYAKYSNQTANCYEILPEGNGGKVYRFKATEGNSSTAVSPVSVEVLWETYNDATSSSNIDVIDAVDYDDTYIYFKLPDTPHAGNAVIAAKDINGNILWSWHIWAPSSAVTSADYGIHTSGKAMMDRNLGALDVAVASTTDPIDVKTVGLFYQWGRKDPFPGPRSITSEGNYEEFARVAGTAPTTGKVQITLEESIKQPTFFARGYYNGGTQENPDWLTPSDATLWGDGTSKSKYDPCPPGYRVPNRDKSCVLWSDTAMSSATGWDYSTSCYWFTVGSPATVFPCVGYCDGGTAKTAFRTIIWNAHSNDYKNSYGFSHYSGYSRRVYYESSTLKFKNDSNSKSLGGSVRCVAE